jgi:hypothetical protein
MRPILLADVDHLDMFRLHENFETGIIKMKTLSLLTVCNPGDWSSAGVAVTLVLLGNSRMVHNELLIGKEKMSISDGEESVSWVATSSHRSRVTASNCSSSESVFWIPSSA